MRQALGRLLPAARAAAEVSSARVPGTLTNEAGVLRAVREIRRGYAGGAAAAAAATTRDDPRLLRALMGGLTLVGRSGSVAGAPETARAAAGSYGDCVKGSIRAPPGSGGVLDVLRMDSVKRKRKRKMNKHKVRKRRKRDRLKHKKP
mmetsp:Transcript_3494/g.12540  ORF Transcript_3494/g.12540 Transcript_3494/m.12540 type:complete len:147 (+) Transcript_3494:3-443(+)